MLTVLFDGIAYGMLLFVLACGLAVTLGLMNFINLAHGAFAMAGGYVSVLLVNRLGVPFAAALNRDGPSNGTTALLKMLFDVGSRSLRSTGFCEYRQIGRSSPAGRVSAPPSCTRCVT